MQTAPEPIVANECRQCCSFCDRLVHPSRCVEIGCPYLYVYDDEASGRRYMGCINKVYKAEIDVQLLAEAERTRHRFGGVRISGDPLPQCKLSVERAYDGRGEAFDCVNPSFFSDSRASGDGVEGSFDLRDRL